ncbi:universal stress protein [Streptomyces sp. NPDC048279]|uniref:universal stress protein n=1 Tax=Streptomyces sp. NPDC048279 TaxID=3154714 RepID=UPI0034418771
MSESTFGNRIVVGVDGSEASLAALRWAGEQARILGVEVVAVHAWEPAAPLAPYAPAAGRPTTAEQRERATALLHSTVRRAFGARPAPSVRVVLVQGPPTRVLLGQTRGARMLALGRRAHGQWQLPAVGTVGRDCLRYAQVPEVTVPPSSGAAVQPPTTGGTALPLGKARTASVRTG